MNPVIQFFVSLSKNKYSRRIHSWPGNTDSLKMLQAISVYLFHQHSVFAPQGLPEIQILQRFPYFNETVKEAKERIYNVYRHSCSQWLKTYQRNAQNLCTSKVQWPHIRRESLIKTLILKVNVSTACNV